MTYKDCIHYDVCDLHYIDDSYCDHFINDSDIVEVVHGKWLTDRFGLDRSICSVCKTTYEGDGGNYCSKCGAKMDKEK